MITPYQHTQPTRDHLVAALGELAGTVLFLLFAFAGTQTAYLNSRPVPNKVGAPANAATLSYIALSFGFSLAVWSWVFFRISGGLFNPAVSLSSPLYAPSGSPVLPCRAD